MIMRSAGALLLWLMAGPAIAHPQVDADDVLVDSLRRTGVRVEAPKSIMWVQQGALDDQEIHAFAESFGRAVVAIERLIGNGIDSSHYGGAQIHVFVARNVGISHVYGSYQHMRYNLPYLFLDAEKVRSGEAPYIHESAHIVAWRFGSHSLREGLASYLEAQIRTEAGLPGSALFGASSVEAVDRDAAARLDAPAAAEVLAWIGATGGASASLT